MRVPDSSTRRPSNGRDALSAAWDARLEGLLPRLPERIGRAAAWLRVPSRRWVRLIAGVALVAGGVLSILGLWMLPLGLALIGEDSPAVKPVLERTARRGERQIGRFRSPEQR